MSDYDKRHYAVSAIEDAELRLQEARFALAGINPDGGEAPVIITPTRFEAAYRGLARAIANGGHDYYDRWTPDSQRTHRGHARAVLEAAGFKVQEP